MLLRPRWRAPRVSPVQFPGCGGSASFLMLLSDHRRQVFRPAVRSENLATTSPHGTSGSAGRCRCGRCTHEGPTGGIASALLRIVPAGILVFPGRGTPGSGGRRVAVRSVPTSRSRFEVAGRVTTTFPLLNTRARPRRAVSAARRAVHVFVHSVRNCRCEYGERNCGSSALARDELVAAFPWEASLRSSDFDGRQGFGRPGFQPPHGGRGR